MGVKGPLSLDNILSYKNRKIDYFTDGWCGPYISDNKFQRSVAFGSHLPKTELGRVCKKHDNQLAQGVDWQTADRKFIRDSQSLGFRGKLYSRLVSLRGFMAKTKLRGSKVVEQITTRRIPSTVRQPRRINKAKSSFQRSKGQVSYTAAPASVGATISSNTMLTRYSQNGDSMTATGQEVVITAGGSANTNRFGLVGAHHINPFYFVGSRLTYFACLYEHFTVNSIILTFIPSLPTSAAGDVLVTYYDDPNQVYDDPSSATFVTRALARPGSVLSSIWRTFTTRLDIPKKTLYTGYSSVPDMRENSLGDIQVYVNGNSTAAGYLICEYNITFSRQIFSPRNYALTTFGDWSKTTSIVQAANPTVGDTVILSSLPTASIGMVMKLYLSFTSPGTGTTLANMWRVQVGASSTAFTVAEGTTIFLLYATTTTAYVFPTYEAAVSGAVNLSTALYAHTITTATQNTTSTTIQGYTLECQLADDLSLLVI